VTIVPELVALLYRADWKQLSLSTTVTWQRDRSVGRQLWRQADAERQQTWGMGKFPRLSEAGDQRTGLLESECRVLLAPGGRYRVETAAGTAARAAAHDDDDDDDASSTRVSDGEFRWTTYAGTARRCQADGPDHAFRGLVTPRWLLACYDLQITGATDVAGRPAHRVTALPRAVIPRFSPGQYHLLDRVDVLVDAELGIILRSEQVFGGQTLELAQLLGLRIDPPEGADPAMFAPPPGLPVTDDQGLGTFEPTGRGWQAAATAAGLAASAMGFAARHAPRRKPRRTPGDTEAAMPASTIRASTEPPSTEPPSPEPPSDDLVNLLHRTGIPAQALTAEWHQWDDEEAVVRCLQAAAAALPQPLAGIFGPDALWDALGEQGREDGSLHKTARLRMRVPGSYRIDYLTGDWRKKYKAVACDGEHTRKLYDDRVAVGPARALMSDLADFVDPAWLLRGWSLSAAGEASVAGRRGLRVLAEPDGPTARFLPFSPVEVIVDAELGIVLRHTSYFGGRPAICNELRNLSPDAAARDGADVFGPGAATGLRVVADSGGLFGDRDLPAPIAAAGTAAALTVGGVIVGAVAVTGWLEKHRARRGTGKPE